MYEEERYETIALVSTVYEISTYCRVKLQKE